MADVRKVVSGTPRELAALDSGILNLSRRLPVTAEGIAAIVAAGAQSGIARRDLLAFAADATKMSIAFDMTADEAGSMMAKWRAAFALDRGGVGKLADQVNYLGNTAGAKASAISGIVTRIGPLGSVAGLASGEIAALGATLASMGVEEEIAATGIKNTMLALTKGAAATKGQKNALKDLGLEATAVSRRMQRDAAGTIMDVMARIAKLPKDVQSGLMTELFGSESIAAIAPLMTQLPRLAENFGRVGDRSKYVGSMQAEFAARAATTANKLQLMNNRVDAMKVRLGERLLPTIERAATGIGKLADRVSGWAERNPVAAELAMKLASVLGLVLLVVGGLGLAIGVMTKPMLMFGSALGWIYRIAMIAIGALATFLGIPVIAAAAIVAGIALLGLAIYNHWGKIKAVFTGGLTWLGSLIGNFRAAGANIVRGLIGGIGSMFAALKAKITGLGKSAVGWFKGVLGIKSPSRVFAQLGGHMMGGLALGLDRGVDKPLARVRAAGVGLTRAMAISAVATAPVAASGGGGSAPIVIEQLIVNAQPGQDAKSLAAQIRAELQRVERGKRAARDSSYQDRD